MYSPAVPSSTVGGVRPPGTGLPAVAGHRVGLGGAVVVGCGHGGRGLVGKQALLPVEQLLGRDVDGLRLTVSHRHLPAINQSIIVVNQSIKQSIEQYNNQSINQRINQSIIQLINYYIIQSIY